MVYFIMDRVNVEVLVVILFIYDVNFVIDNLLGIGN